ncbi:MAG: hypothetical protein JEZ00_12205 [Anaerolineaceae bacterium]|nr:hypothetical protein [Anaerolineaceae bacterium]
MQYLLQKLNWKKIEFLLAFVNTPEQVTDVTELIKHKWSADEQVWFTYPKKSSYNDSSQIAMGEDWSALCFRRSVFGKGSK